MTLSGEYAPSTSPRSRDQVALYEATGGTQGNTMHGLPVIILTSLGARSGKVRKIPLMRVEHEGTYAVVASMGGAPTNPKWYYNLVAHPQVQLQDGPVPVDLVAREVTGAERDLWWQRAVAAFAPYAEYERKTDRVILVFVLDPAVVAHSGIVKNVV